MYPLVQLQKTNHTIFMKIRKTAISNLIAKINFKNNDWFLKLF